MKRLGWLVVTTFFLFSYSVLGQAKPPKKTSELLSQGKKIYGQTCAPCHGTKGDGKGPAGAVLKPAPTDFTKPPKEWPATKGNPEKIFEVITKGIPDSAMVPWTQYSEKERWGLTYYVMEFARKK